MSKESYSPTEEVALIQSESEHRFHTDPTFYARVKQVRQALYHTGLSERQITWVLEIDDKTRASLLSDKLTREGR